jgi:Ca2+-binding EF-hand superfamily protein
MWERSRLRLMEMFRFIDRNRDGLVSVAELTRGLAELELDLSPADARALAAAADTDGDGKIKYSEFLAYFRPVRAKPPPQR